MTLRLSRVSAVVVGVVTCWCVTLSPQAQQQPQGPPSMAAPAQAGEAAVPAPGGGRGGRGGLGGPEENDPANATADYGPKPPIKILTPEEQAKKFWLPAGYRLEPVLSVPTSRRQRKLASAANARCFF